MGFGFANTFYGYRGQARECGEPETGERCRPVIGRVLCLVGRRCSARLGHHPWILKLSAGRNDVMCWTHRVEMALDKECLQLMVEPYAPWGGLMRCFRAVPQFMERGVVGRLIIIDSGSGVAGITVVKGRGCRRSMIVPPSASEKVQKVGICLARPYKGWLASKDLPNRRQSWIKWVVSGKDWLLCKITRDKGEFAIYSAI